jgi:hypothetical protein
MIRHNIIRYILYNFYNIQSHTLVYKLQLVVPCDLRSEMLLDEFHFAIQQI